MDTTLLKTPNRPNPLNEMETEGGNHMLEKLRAELVEKGMQLGFQHPEVIALSQKVDKLHNEINRKKVRGNELE